MKKKTTKEAEEMALDITKGLELLAKFRECFDEIKDLSSPSQLSMILTVRIMLSETLDELTEEAEKSRKKRKRKRK